MKPWLALWCALVSPRLGPCQASHPWSVYLRDGGQSPLYTFAGYSFGRPVLMVGAIVDSPNDYAEYLAGAGVNLFAASGNGASLLVLGLQLAGLLTLAGVVGVTRYYSMRGQLYREVGTSAENLIQVIEETVAERPELLQPGVLDPVVDRFTYKLPAVARVSVVDPTFTILADSRLPVGQASDQTALLPLLRRVDEERFYYVTKGCRYP